MAKNIPKSTLPNAQAIDWKAAVENNANQSEVKVVPIFSIWGKGAVHESIAKEAAKLAKVPYTTALEKGVEWPDVPSTKPGETNYPGLINGDLYKKGTITNDSHYGQNQFWHSMAPPGKLKNGEVLDKIVNQAVQWYEQAQKEENIFHVGKVLHIVQDSFSEAHTMRTTNGKIVTFQSYDKQDPNKHEKADVIPLWGTWRDVPGAIPALQASTKILELYKSEANSKALEEYLRNQVFPFENGLTKDQPAGGTNSKYAPTRAENTTEQNHYANLDKVLQEILKYDTTAENKALMMNRALEVASSNVQNTQPHAPTNDPEVL